MTISPVFNYNKTQMVMKAETTMGTAATLAASDNDIKWIPESISVEIDMEQFDQWYASGRHSQGPGTTGKRKATIKARAPMLLGAALGTAPKITKALKACGQTETVVSVTSVAWTPDATKDQGDNINVTIGVIFVPTSGSALLITVKGCMGNVKYVMDQGGFPIICDFDFMGCLVGITDGSALALTSPDTGYAPGTLGNSCTIASVQQAIAKMELDAGNTIEMDEDGTDGTGYGAAYIAKRDPKLNIDPKAKLIATDPAWTRLLANTEAAFSMTTAAISGIKLTLSAPKAQHKPFKLGKRGSELTWDQSFNLHENTANDEFQLIQSA